MSVIEKDNVFYCDCGFSWRRGMSGSHCCEDGLRVKLDAAEKRIAELSGEFFALPPLNDDLIAILGRPNFTCAHLAELLRKGGQDIRRKSEFEQAAVIYWFLDLYLKYGDKWESIAKDDIQSRVAAAGIGVKGE